MCYRIYVTNSNDYRDTESGYDFLRSFYCADKAAKVQALLDHYTAVGKLLGVGRHRAGFLVEGMVVKVALSEAGLEANRSEVQRATIGHTLPYPITDCCAWGEFCVLAEYVRRPERNSDEYWAAVASMSSSGHVPDAMDYDTSLQFGLRADGTPVCFNYGD